MIIWNSFEKKYPLLNKYITEESIRSNMLKNKDLLRKYVDCEDSIKTFIFELEKSFDVDTISKFISDTILKLPDEVLLSFITAYLNSDSTSKCNPNIYIYYNKIAQYGVEAIKYIESHGIITDRTYKNMPIILERLEQQKHDEDIKLINTRLNEEYREYDTQDIVYSGTYLDDLFHELKIEEKKTVLSFLKNNSFELFNDIFSNFNYSLETLIHLLSKFGIDSTIINKKLLDEFSSYELMILVYELIDFGNFKIVDNINELIKHNKIKIVRDILINDFVDLLDNFSKEEMSSLTSDQLLRNLSNEKKLKREV